MFAAQRAKQQSPPEKSAKPSDSTVVYSPLGEGNLKSNYQRMLLRSGAGSATFFAQRGGRIVDFGGHGLSVTDQCGLRADLSERHRHFPYPSPLQNLENPIFLPTTTLSSITQPLRFCYPHSKNYCCLSESLSHELTPWLVRNPVAEQGWKISRFSCKMHLLSSGNRRF